MKTNRNKMWIEITLIILAGLVTIGLSVKAVVENNKQENETKRYQEESKQLQQEVKQKTEKIIELNGQLRNLADLQTQELKNMTKQIPKDILLSYSAVLKMNVIELEQFQKYFETNDKESNLFTKENYNKFSVSSPLLEQLLASGVRINLKIIGNRGKEIDVIYGRNPIDFVTMPFASNSSILYYQRESNDIKIDGNLFHSITCNSTSYTLYDFRKFDIIIRFEFSNPRLINNVVLFTVGGEQNIQLENLSINLYLENKNGYHLTIDHFSQEGKNTFKGKGYFDLN